MTQQDTKDIVKDAVENGNLTWSQAALLVIYRLDSQDEQLKGIGNRLDTFGKEIREQVVALDKSFAERVNNVDKVFAAKVNEVDRVLSEKVSEVKSSVTTLNLKVAGIAVLASGGMTGLIKFFFGG